jgi:agmatine deiminase
MACNPGQEAEVRDRCGSGISVEEIPVDDSWARDSGPIVVTDGTGRRAVVQLGFNGWGGKYLPYDADARLATAVAGVLGLPVFRAPIITEGGAFLVDGEGTAYTTRGSVLNDARNPGMTREQVDAVFVDYLGVEKVVWLEAFPDRDTDGHIDGIANLVAPGVIALQVPSDPRHELASYSQGNVELFARERDARGREVTVLPVAPLGHGVIDGEQYDIPYLNHYLPNGGVVVPTGDPSTDDEALERLAEVYPGREVVGVPGTLLSYGGGGPHCITQQIPRL